MPHCIILDLNKVFHISFPSSARYAIYELQVICLSLSFPDCTTKLARKSGLASFSGGGGACFPTGYRPLIQIVRLYGRALSVGSTEQSFSPTTYKMTTVAKSPAKKATTTKVINSSN